MSVPIESDVTMEFVVKVDPGDIARGLSGDDGILTFVCQLIAHAHSPDLREDLLDRLGVVNLDGAHFDAHAWQDGDYLPSEQA